MMMMMVVINMKFRGYQHTHTHTPILSLIMQEIFFVFINFVMMSFIYHYYYCDQHHGWTSMNEQNLLTINHR